MAWRDALRVLRQHSFVLALLLTIVLLVLNIVKSGSFDWSDQLANLAPLALASIASTPSILSGGGGFDLTISPVMTFLGGVIAVWLVPHQLGGIELVPIVLGAGAAIGAANGLIIMLLRVPPVVATLSMYFVFLGVDLEIAPTPVAVPDSSWLANLAGSVGPIPGAVLTIGAPLAIWALLGLTPYRRTLLAVGSNDAAAFSAGVNVALVRIGAYALGGLFAAIGAIALVALVLTVDATAATTYTLLAVAGVALGGTPLTGGRGGVVGPLLGAASIYLLGNLLLILQVNPSWLQVMYGGMLVVAVVLSGGLASAGRRQTV